MLTGIGNLLDDIVSFQRQLVIFNNKLFIPITHLEKKFTVNIVN